MSEVKRVADPKEGPSDGVSAEVRCVVTKFQKNAKKKINGQRAEMCRILCSYSEGGLSLSARESDVIVTVRLDEVIEVIAKAAEAAKEIEGAGQKEQY